MGKREREEEERVLVFVFLFSCAGVYGGVKFKERI